MDLPEPTKDRLTNQVVDTTDAGFLVDAAFPGRTLVVSFAYVDWKGRPRFDFFGRLKKLENRSPDPINKIFLRDDQNAWYHRGVPGLGSDVDEVAAGLRQIIDTIRPGRVITIGQSMGAYAAIMFGALLDADKSIAFGPLSYLNSQEALLYHERRWLATMEQLEARPPPVRYFDLPALCRRRGAGMRIEVFFGTMPDAVGYETVNLDAVHAQRLASLPNCTLHPFPESDHAIVQYLIDCKLIDDLLYREIVQGTPRPAGR